MSRTIAVGDITIQQIVEQQAPAFDMHTFFPKLSKEMLDANRSWLEPRYVDPATNKIVLAIQSYVVRTAHHTILVDSCVGNHKPRPNRPHWHMMDSPQYMTNLAALDLTVADIDFVMCTHMHVDHTGWNTRLENGRWVPTFPNARYLFSERELAFWTARQATDPASCPWIEDSVLPIVAAGRADLVKSDHAFNDHVHLIPTPGHTIDHFSVEIGGLSGAPDARAIIAGDMVHSPLQVRYPELGMQSDYSSEQAGATRRTLFGRIADTPTRLCTAHFHAPSTGRIVTWNDSFDFVSD